MVVGWRTNWFVHIQVGRLSLTWRIMKAGQRLRFYSILAFLLCSGDPVITVTYCHRVFLSMFPVRYPKKKWIQSIWLQGQRKQRFYRKRRRNSKLEFFIREQCLVMNIKDELSILNQVVFISRLVVIAHICKDDGCFCWTRILMSWSKCCGTKKILVGCCGLTLTDS